ncbi:hypothetical protein BT93_L5221 [Corymbia citriodora subsp. variegata]|uniref:ATP11-domain-containing protein n=1 Tax=Corymbia citriodora subsp. variegata TaxID=360336 RepID=A0A8T0CFA7_CORYI|nr:hypothetical protein BT93_L5221 [Corymbia citriodora subsp. variegata]
MSYRPVVCLRHSLRPSCAPIRAQKRFARVHDVRFVASRHASSIKDRYRDKLEEKARAEGHESVAAMTEAYRERIKQLKEKAAIELGQQQTQVKNTFNQPPPPPPQTGKDISKTKPSSKERFSGIKPLSSYLDLEKVAALPRKEIEYLWRLRHANNPQSLCAVMTTDTYRRIYETAKTHPRFILPLPRPAAEDGSGDVQQAPNGFKEVPRSASDIHFLQWSFLPPAVPPPPGVQTLNTHTSTILFTHLAAFKLHGEFAQPHTVVTHHLDLADSHGIVLLNGQVTEGKGVSVEEGKWLLLCMQKFYDHDGHGGGVGKEKRQNLLKKFSKGDSDFDVAELVDEAERIS